MMEGGGTPTSPTFRDVARRAEAIPCTSVGSASPSDIVTGAQHTLLSELEDSYRKNLAAATYQSSLTATKRTEVAHRAHRCRLEGDANVLSSFLDKDARRTSQVLSAMERKGQAQSARVERNWAAVALQRRSLSNAKLEDERRRSTQREMLTWGSTFYRANEVAVQSCLRNKRRQTAQRLSAECAKRREAEKREYTAALQRMEHAKTMALHTNRAAIASEAARLRTASQEKMREYNRKAALLREEEERVLRREGERTQETTRRNLCKSQIASERFATRIRSLSADPVLAHSPSPPPYSHSTQTSPAVQRTPSISNDT
eukprot:Sspe_Gene.77126::Locus_48169_Transcript_1_1_Confidence_1.000_Length_1216::g.77126::m.77126